VKKSLFLAAAAVLAAGLLRVNAQVAPPAMAMPGTAVTGKGDQLDFVYLASDRPVLLRVHLRMGDKVYDAAWHEFLDRFFKYLDRNNDGFLTGTEVNRVPNSNYLTNTLNGSIGYPFQGQNAPLAQLDTNKDGKVSRDEFKDYYRRMGFTALSFSFNTYQANFADQQNKTFWKLLDKDGDGKLTKEELAAAPGLLKKLDANEDEMLSAAEVNGQQSSSGSYAVAVTYAGGGMMASAPGAAFQQLAPGAPRDGLARQVLAFYDRNKDGKLARDEIALDRARFDALDRNKDGFLDAQELKAFFDGEPDLTFRGQVGEVPQGKVNGLLARVGLPPAFAPKGVTRLQVIGPPVARSALARSVKKLNDNTLGFQLGDTHFEIQGNQGYRNDLSGTKQFFLQQFDSTVDKKKGHIDRKDVVGNNMFSYIGQLFDLADGNGDGKLTRKELSDYLDVQASGGGCRVNISVNDLGRSLFEHIDADGDNQLSVRELRNAWERVKKLAKDGKGLAQNDIPRRMQMSMAQGNGGFAFVNRRAVRRAQPPVWFRKMDRNNDGDLSPREFLGTEAEFKMLDTDGDGLISVEEALQYEAKRKKDATKAEEPAKK
jgi:Ca2+-binding EF-hand superfamily protein